MNRAPASAGRRGLPPASLRGGIVGILLVAFLGSACRTAPQPGLAAAPEPSLEETVARLGASLERWEAFGFSGAVLVAQGDRVLLSRGFGLADRAAGIPVTSETLFDIGSLSKQLTAAAVLALADEGRLAVEDPIAELVADVPVDKAGITVHQLLTHTSGISDFVPEEPLVSRDALVGAILAAPLSRPPGESYEYSNLSYALLAAIVEIVSGERFEQYAERALFAPAGLRHTTFTWSHPDAPAAPLALGYGGFREVTEGEDPRQRHDTWESRGGGGALSSIEELLRWDRALWDGQVLSAESRALMFSPHTAAEAEFLTYGYGWRMQDTAGGGRLIWHSGLDEAFGAMLRHYVEENVVLVFLSNLSIGGVPMRDVLAPPSRSGPPASELVAPAVGAAPAFEPDPSRLQHYGGRYRVGEAGWWEATIERQALVLNAEGQEAIDALFPPADPSEAATYERANEEATRLARCLATRTCPREDVERIDPLGYARRGAPEIADEWRRTTAELGDLQEVRVLGTTGMRGRRPGPTVTRLRLQHARGSRDEHVIWWAEDEVYWIPGMPSTFAVRFQPAPARGLVGFDLLTQRTFEAELSEDGSRLTVTSDPTDAAEGTAAVGLRE